jgi:hypothetical protein
VTVAPEEVKSCCAAAYSTEAARYLLGERFHPGGAELTSRLVRELRVGPGQLVADVASGPGASALQLAGETGCDVVGIDLSPASVEAATQAAHAAGLEAQVRFAVGDAEALPLDDGSVDGILCECALCTFPDKAAAAAEFRRVLRPGACLALSDMTADRDRLPPELTGLAAWVACIADARPLDEVAALLAGAGLRVEQIEARDDALGGLLDRVEARLRLARVVAAPLVGDAVDSGLDMIGAARGALADGALGYGVIIARRP